MKLKSLLVFIAFFLFFTNSKSASITGFVIDNANLANKSTIYGNSVINLNQSGTTSITSLAQIKKYDGEIYSFTFALGTVTNSGTLFPFGGTATLDSNNDGNIHGTTAAINIYSNIDPSQPVNNKIMLLYSTDRGSTWSLYPSKTYITSYPVNPQPFYRYRNTSNDEYLYTMDASELNGVNGYVKETNPGNTYIQSDGTLLPLYRYYNSSSQDHFYTLTQGTINGYSYERIAAFVYNSQIGTSIPLYQYFSLQRGHLFTTDYSELGSGAYGFTYEKVACYNALRAIKV